MAEFEIVYKKGYCDLDKTDYCGFCHSEHGEDVGCPNFDGGGDDGSCMIQMDYGRIGFLYGDCIHAKYHYCYKGMTAKRYEINTDWCDRKTNCIIVTINGKTYECAKVKLNGKCIFNEFDDEEETQHGKSH